MANNKRTFEYGQRPSPTTTYANMQKIKRLFEKKKLVTFEDMQKTTGKKWVRGFFNALKMVRKVEPVRDGREIIGYRFKTKHRARPTKASNDNNDNSESVHKAA